MLRVLVIEDDQDTAATSAMLLRLDGYQVEVAIDAPSAVQTVRANPPDVVLLDIAMPQMDGWQVAQEIQQHCNDKRPFIIAVSGYGMEADQRRSQEVGIDLHLVKPVDPKQLAGVLKRFRSIVEDSDASA